MLNTYTQYIENYIKNKKPIPGEHHFVSTYLLPRFFDITEQVPDYVNPDGMKDIPGDIVYDGGVSIEVKLDTIKLTRKEYNSWIVSEEESVSKPKLFIGICTPGLILCSWQEFRKCYITAVQARKNEGGWQPKFITKGYGPSKSINILFKQLPKEMIFRVDSHGKAEENEQRFMHSLENLVSPFLKPNVLKS